MFVWDRLDPFMGYYVTVDGVTTVLILLLFSNV